MTNLNAHQFPDLDDPQGLLEPDPLYHGTSTFEPKVGDKILPPKKSGAHSHWGHLDNDIGYGQSVTGHAFAATNEDAAWEFAAQRAEDTPNVRPAVYKVRPLGDVEEGAEGPHEVRSKAGFAVTDRIDIRPGHQGTLPLNWAQHAKYSSQAYEANHPYDDGPEVPTTRAYPYQLSEVSETFPKRQTAERNAVEAGQHELFDSTKYRGDEIAVKGAAMRRFVRGEINEQGLPETRKFPYYPRKGS